jgi:DNA modification methylase
VRDLTCRLKPYIQPFERILALRELAATSGDEPRPLAGQSAQALEFSVTTPVTPDALSARLAYWETVSAGSPGFTRQLLREATVNVVRNGITLPELATRVPFCGEVPLPNRRCLRYGPHGLHEYRGKFFPQLVTSLLNIGRVPAGGRVLDPMCGSGTTLVEALLAGYHATGFDLNPLSVLMSRTKCSILTLPPAELAQCYEGIRQTLATTKPKRSARMPYFESLAIEDQAYLLRWFSLTVLADLDQIVMAIQAIGKPQVRDLAQLSLSNILRRVSWQKEDDLRVRREIKEIESDPIQEFLEEMGQSVRLVLALLYQEGALSEARFDVRELDARDLGDLKYLQGAVDAVITSPPYATALPYLDTDRLSLLYLKLLSRPKHRPLDEQMIGNREITRSAREVQWQEYQADRDTLPAPIVRVIDTIAALNEKAQAGFRRMNLPSLLAKYFKDLKAVLSGIEWALKPGAPAFVIVGNNHTTADGWRIDIKTAEFLAELSAQAGLETIDLLPMEMLVSRDIFKKNAGSCEYILMLRKTCRLRDDTPRP